MVSPSICRCHRRPRCRRVLSSTGCGGEACSSVGSARDAFAPNVIALLDEVDAARAGARRSDLQAPASSARRSGSIWARTS